MSVLPQMVVNAGLQSHSSTNVLTQACTVACCPYNIEPCVFDITDLAKAQGGAAAKGIAAHPPRATDAFYAKLLPALEVSSWQ